MASSLLNLALLLFTFSCRNSLAQVGLSFFEQDCLETHNNFRSLHAAVGLLTWNAELAEGARNWSQFLLQNQSLLHQDDVLNSQNLGENLGFVNTTPPQPLCSNSSQTSCVRCSQIITAWYNEISNYNFETGSPVDPNEQWLHFTQMVWRVSTELGMGVASGEGLHYFVARYKPRGNIRGRFDRNVPRLRPTEPPTTTAPPTTMTSAPPTTAGAPATTTAIPGPPTTTGLPDTTTGPPDTTTGPPATTTGPTDTTTPPSCLSNREPASQEEITNSVSMVIPNFTILEWCTIEVNFTQIFAERVSSFCATSGVCPFHPTPSDVEVVILPGFPRVNSPLELRLFIRLRSDMNTTFTLASERLNTIMESFLRNISDAFGIEFTVDGNFTNWGPWGACSSSCGPGTQMRFRNCTNPPPINNGSDCQGPRNETQACDLGPCPTSTTSPPVTATGPPNTTTGSQDTTTGPPDTTTGQPDTTTGPLDTTTGPPDTTTGPLITTTGPPDTTTPPSCLWNRQPATPEEITNSRTLVIPNFTILEWCAIEVNFTQLLAERVASFCASTGLCPFMPTPSEVSVVILPGFPRVNSPLEVRFSIRLTGANNNNFTLPIEQLTTILEAFLGDLSNAVGIQITVDGNFTNFGPWGACSSSCGPGTQMRFRNCTNPPPINNGSDCQGPMNETQACDLGPCPACTPPGAFLTGSSGFFSSPNFPNDFPANSDCTWNITVPSGFIIKVTFFSFTLEPFQNTDCAGALNGARVFITNVASDDGASQFKLCGQQLPSPVYSSSNSIQVRLLTLNDLYAGFNASYLAITEEELCPNVTLTEPSGAISSPFYPRLYPDNQACRWHLTAPAGEHIRLFFESINIQQCGAKGECTCDYVEIQNGLTAAGASSERICGVLVDDGTYYSIGESLTVLFVSDASASKSFDGFRATFTHVNSTPFTVAPLTTVPPTTPACVLPNRRTPSQEEINNAISIIILNITLQQWCLIEDEFRLRLANFVTDFCNAQIGVCANSPLPSDVDLINILPGFPVVNSPLELRFYARLKAGINQHVTIDRNVLLLIFEDFARNISDAIGVEFTADGNFTNWGPWGACSSSCGPGTQMRFRNCTNPPPINNGQDCQGPRNETQACDSGPCPVDGNFTQWENWSRCSATCGTGVQTRYRSCTNPPPSNNGRDCNGTRMETKECQIIPCPVDGNFTEWGLWAPCSQTCGNGTQSRYRNCTNPPPQHDGRDCVGPHNETQDCFDRPCPVDGNFTEWGAWSGCSQTCGNGTQIRVRNCTNPPQAHGGLDCMGPRNESRECYEGPCPIDGNYTQWTAWSACSETCGNGTQTRYRSCINPPPSNGGRECVGPRNETQQCFLEPCIPRMYAYGTVAGDTKLPAYHLYRQYCRRLRIPGQGMPFFVRQHNKVYICRNGLLRFITGSVLRWPERFPGIRGSGSHRFQRAYVLATYWSNINHFAFRISDTNKASKVFYQVYSKNILGDVSSSHAREFFDRANSDVQQYQTNPSIPNFNATWGLKVTWVRLYPHTYPVFIPMNTFQIVVVTDGQHSFTLFNYPENGMEWASNTGTRFLAQNQRGLPVMGYNAGDPGMLRFYNLPGAGTVEADKVDERLGNSNRKGVWFFRLDVNPVLDLPAKKCYTWTRQQANVRVPRIRPCPCTFDQAIADKNFYVDYNQKIAGRGNLTTCAYSVPYITSRWAQQCCYTERPGAGRVLAIGQPEGGTPFLIGISGLPIITDLEAHQFCCSSSLCARYYQLRPSDTCSRYDNRREALIWGDPHFVTLDNKVYTFNGLGEYTMVTIDNAGFELQARTKKTSGRGLGTVFSAAAATEANTSTVEGRINSKGELEVLVAGIQQNISTIAEIGTVVPDSNIVLIRDTAGSITALFPSGISVNFASISDALAIAFNGPDRFKNHTRGLLGTWNDDPSDDFTFPDGTVLPADASPQRIHYEFGLKWQIDASQSLFTYQAHESPTTFMDLSYVPMFIDNITWTNDSFRRQAEIVCGNNTHCLFDAAVTVDKSFGMSTKELEENNNQINNKLATFPPQIDGPQVINATLNETVEVTITARHNTSNSFVFTVKFFPDIELVSNTSQSLVVRWRPTSINKVEPVFIVTDSSNSSSELRPLIRLCACQNGGNCFEDDDVQRQLDSGVRFIVLSCGCPVGLTGQFCESNVDACVENNDPCFPGVECTNVPFSVNQAGYTCGPCPSGYHGNGATCTDNDECLDHVSSCSQSCINTPGSYVCECYPGYKLQNDGVSCNDINECVDANDCMHRCTNYPGGRNCSCFEGFQVDPADDTACIPIASCNVSQAGCQQVCVEDQGQPKCSCHKGYQLTGDSKTCVDIDECHTHRHRCSQNCHNTEGGYTCSCDAGYTLDPNQMTCNDVDECGLIDVVYCADSLELCINTIGSFHCECQQGYQRANNTCEEIFPTTVGPSSTVNPTSSVKTDYVPEDVIDNAVAMTIRNTDISEWEDGLSQSFEETIAQVIVAYCQQDENDNCRHSKLNKRSISRESLTASVHLLKQYPQQHQADLVIAFYVILHSHEQENYLMTRDALLQAMKQSAATLSARINKEVYNIRAYHEDDGRPPPRESRIDESQPKWIIIGVSLAVIVVMVIVIVVVCSRRRRASSRLNKNGRSSEFILRQWAGTPEDTVFLGITNQATKL